MTAGYFLSFKGNAVEKGGVIALIIQDRFYRSGILISVRIVTVL